LDASPAEPGVGKEEARQPSAVEERQEALNSAAPRKEMLAKVKQQQPQAEEAVAEEAVAEEAAPAVAEEAAHLVCHRSPSVYPLPNAKQSTQKTNDADFFTNIHLCRILLSKMTPAEKYCHFWPGGSA
jgi:hypothetical protein